MASINTEPDQEMQRLMEFLYVAPVALIEFDDTGALRMANPRAAQLFNRYAPGGYFNNFFQFLDDVLPELKQVIIDYPKDSGQIMENRRFCITAPDGHQGQDEEILWMDVTVMRQETSRYIASLNNVTDQVNTLQ